MSGPTSIEALVPHRPPMLWVDEVLSTEPDRTRVLSCVSESWPLARDGHVPAVVALELIAQAAAVHAGLGTGESGGGAGYVVSCPALSLRVRALLVGDLLETEVQVEQAGQLTAVLGVVYREEEVVAQGEVRVWREVLRG